MENKITFSDAEISKKIVSLTKEIINLTGDENKYLADLLNVNQKIVNSYNLENLLTIDITPTEIGRFNSTIKKIAVGHYKVWFGLKLEIDPNKELLYSYTIFQRKLNAKNTWKRNSLEYTTTKIFKTEILNRLIHLNG